ncbi:MAG: SpoIIIAH-like family protein [Eubacterium sp.]|nr:SpoIIIAH-like family protein [Eubacterium sp.]
MKKLFKKNQVIITALALMIAAAGYLSYTYSGIGSDELTQTSAELTEEDYDISSEETLADAEIFTETEIDTEKESGGKKDAKAADSSAASSGDAKKDTAKAQKGEKEDIENPGETVLASTNVSNVDFAVEAKLNREQVRSQNKEDLMEVIDSKALSDTDKQAAVDKMVNLTDIAQRETDAEMLLEAKGFTDVVVSITEDSADVVLNMGDVTDAKRAQIEDIVKRKTKVSAEHIVITPITTGEKEK